MSPAATAAEASGQPTVSRLLLISLAPISAPISGAPISAPISGKIEARRGNDEAAEERFLVARAGFLEQRNAYDAAMVSLEDLAVTYLRQGRTAEVRQLAEEMVAVFQEPNLPEDALRALRLCAAAAQREELTAAMARGCAAQIRRVIRPEGRAAGLEG